MQSSDPVPEVAVPVKRGRGRPRKIPLAVVVSSDPPLPVIKRPRGRPRKVITGSINSCSISICRAHAAPVNTTPAPVVAKVVMPEAQNAYILLPFTDLEFYAINTEREPFISAFREAKLINKKGGVPEIRWYADKITVIPANSK